MEMKRREEFFFNVKQWAASLLKSKRTVPGAKDGEEDANRDHWMDEEEEEEEEECPV